MSAHSPFSRPAALATSFLVALVLATAISGCSAIPLLISPTSTPTPTPTSTPTATPTSTPTPTATATPTVVPLTLSLRLEPDSVPQGQIGTLIVESNRPATVTASLQGKPFQLFQDGNRWYGLVGIWAGTQPGTWPVLVTAVGPEGGSALIERGELRISARKFDFEAIDLTEDTLNLLLDQDALQKEAQMLADLLAPRTPRRLWQGTFQRPVQGEVSSTYGMRRSYNGGPPGEYHGGLDLATDEGVPVGAANSGQVVFAGPLKVRGNVVIIDHGWGLYSGYFHMSALKVATGDEVQKGQPIGLVGSTGLSTGPHVHWAMWLGGYSIDPAFVESWQLPG